MPTLPQLKYFFRANADGAILDDESRQYLIKDGESAQEDNFQEKLLQRGAASLNSAELLSLIIDAKSSLSEKKMRDLISEYGERTLASQSDPRFWHKEFTIPLDQACRIAACLEIGRRFFEKNKNGLIVVRTAKQAFGYFQEMRNLAKEQLRGLYLNSRYQVIHDEIISIGTLTANIVHPREVFKPALEYSAAAIIIAHNHPSGSIKATKADIEITRQLVMAGKIMNIELLDHIIIAGNKFASVPVEY